MSRINRRHVSAAARSLLTVAASGSFVLLLASCGGSQLAGTSSPNASTTTHTTGAVSLRLVGARSFAELRHAAARRSAQYVSPSTLAMTVTLTPNGSSGPAFTRTFACSTTSCNATFVAPSGAASLALSLADASSGSGNVLSLATAPVTILANTTNAFTLTADPIVASARVVLGNTGSAAVAVNAGTAIDVPVTVQALDADGNVVVGPGRYLDTAGNPMTLTVSSTNASAGGNGTVALSGASSVSSAGSVAATAHYDGGWLDHATISVASTSSRVAVVAPATVTTVPNVVSEYTIPTSGSGPSGIAAGGDGNIWFTEYNAGKVAKITPAGTVTEYPYPLAGTCGPPFHMTAVPDGSLWFGANTGACLEHVSLDGTITDFSIHGARPTQLSPAPNGDIVVGTWTGWTVESLTPSGVNTFHYSSTNVTGIVVGPDGATWFTEYYADKIGRLSTTGVLTTYPVPSPGSGLADITVGSDGAMWFTHAGGNTIGRVTTAGTVTEYPIPTAGAGPTGIVSGVDGALWFCETNANKIGRITTSGQFSEYPIPTVNAFANYLTPARDGSIWFGETGANKIGKLVL